MACFSEQTVGKRGVQTPIQRECTLWLNAQTCYTRRQQKEPIRPSSSGPLSLSADDTRQVIEDFFQYTPAIPGERLWTEFSLFSTICMCFLTLR